MLSIDEEVDDDKPNERPPLADSVLTLEKNTGPGHRDLT